MEISTNSPKHILYIRNDRLGDFLLNLPSIRTLKRSFPNSKISVVINPSIQELFSPHPDMDELIEFDPFSDQKKIQSWIKLFFTLRKQKYDLAIISNPHKYFHLLTFLLKIPHRLGYQRKWDFFLTHKIPDQKHLNQKHEIEYNLDLIAEVVKPPDAAKPSDPMNHLLSLSSAEEQTYRTLFKKEGISFEKPIMVINPFTTAPHKQWPIPKFNKLIHILIKKGQWQIALIGGKLESVSIKKEMLPHFDNQRVFDFSGKLSLKELAFLLKQAHLLISNDSGPVHIACAWNTATLVLFGALTQGSHPLRWGPWGKGEHRIIQKNPIESIEVEDVCQKIDHP